MVHGDDFVLGGSDEDLKWVAKVLAAKFVIKVRADLGPEDENQKDEVLLGRFVRWGSLGIECEADVKYRKLLFQRFGLGGSAKAFSITGDWRSWVVNFWRGTRHRGVQRVPCSSREFEILGSGLSRCSMPSKRSYLRRWQTRRWRVGGN